MANEEIPVGGTATHDYGKVGTYTVVVVDTVTSLSTNKTITIAPFGTAPNFTITRAKPEDYAKATFTPVSADHDYQLDWGDETDPITIAKDSRAPLTHDYPPGAATYTIVGSDEINGKATTKTFEAQAVPNAPEFTMTQDTIDKLKWTLELTKSDNPCSIDWGDGDGERRAYTPPPMPQGTQSA